MPSTTPHLESLIIRAGAGAGKTTRLTRHVLSVATSYYSEHQKWPKMVVSTFTRKATQELRERLISLCSDPEYQHLIPFVTSQSRLHISTIHGVLSLFLRRYGHLVGIDNSFSIIDDKAAHFLAKKIVAELSLEDELWAQYIEQYGNDGLAKMCRRYYEAQLIWGDIKTHDIADHKNSFSIVAKSLGVKLQDISQGILQEADDKWMEFGKSLGQLAQNFCSGSSFDQLSKSYEELASKPRVSKTTSEVLKDCSAEFQEFKTELGAFFSDPLYDSSSWEKFVHWGQGFSEIAGQFVENYISQKMTAGQIEMSDLEGLAGKVIRDEPELAKEFSKDWNYWMIDEFQDTSPAQTHLLDQLIGESPRFIVGDPQQSIYLFRGARSEVFFDKETQFEKRGWSKEKLMKNFRSEGSLLEGINQIVTNISSKQFQSMEPKSNPRADQVRITWASCKQNIEGHSELEYILWQVCELIKSGSRFEDICILGRNHKTLSDISIHLKENRIPVTLNGGASYQLKQEVVEAKALLHFLLNPQNNKALLSLCRSPWFYINDQDIVNTVFAQKRPYWFLFKENLSEHTSVQKLEGYLSQLSEKGFYETFKLALLDCGMLTASHIYDVTGKREANIWKLLLSVKEQEIQSGFSFYHYINDSHIAYDEESLGQDGEASSPLNDNRVQMMTVHASKGLQFKHVIIPSCHKKPNFSQSALEFDHFVFNEFSKSWGISFPLDGKKQSLSITDKLYIRGLQQREELESERVFYVAATRAIDSLHFSQAKDAASHSWSCLLESAQASFDNNSVFAKVEGPWVAELPDVQREVSKDYMPAVLKPKNASFKKISVSALLEDVNAPGFSGETSFQSVLKPIEGIHLHAIFEKLNYDSNFDFQSYCEKWLGEKRVFEVVDSIQWALDTKEFPFTEVLSQGHVEWGYQYLKDNQIIEGQVDLWGVVENTCYIVDYKTGSTRYTDKAFMQLAQYAQAIRALHGFEEIRLVVLFPIEKSLVIRSFESLTISK